MLMQSQRLALPTEENWFQQSLAETIVWCTGLPLENNPHEDSEIERRRELGRKAGALYRKAHLSNWPEPLKRLLYGRASRMFARARLLEIAPLEKQLRSLVLQSDPFLPDPTRDKSAQIVAGVISRRAEKLASEGRAPATTTAGLQDGKLLLFSPEETLVDGAARYSSKGFFDVDNVPPWDTWVGFHDQYVVSWVPPQLIELAGAGVDANPEQCILWA